VPKLRQRTVMSILPIFQKIESLKLVASSQGQNKVLRVSRPWIGAFSNLAQFVLLILTQNIGKISPVNNNTIKLGVSGKCT